MMKYSFQNYSIDHSNAIEKDLQDSFFFLQPKYFFQFFFFFFFRVLYGVLYCFFYIKIHRKSLIVDKVFTCDISDGKDVLFMGDSTLCFPVQNYSFPYKYFQNKYAKMMKILAKPGLRTHMLYDFAVPRLDRNDSYDTIFIASFLNDIVHANVTPQKFELGTKKLFETMQQYLKPGGKIIYIYGDFSLHPIVPNNYFKRYFHYKTYRFLGLIEKYTGNDIKICKLMDFQPTESKKYIKSCFYYDGLHFSKVGQKRLYDDLINNLKNN